MNHILKLQEENKALKLASQNAQEEIQFFLAHLCSAKFTGTENGERKDWIATGDVIIRLQEIRGALQRVDFPV